MTVAHDLEEALAAAKEEGVEGLAFGAHLQLLVPLAELICDAAQQDDHETLATNLRNTQTRCNELLAEARAYKMAGLALASEVLTVDDGPEPSAEEIDDVWNDRVEAAKKKLEER